MTKPLLAGLLCTCLTCVITFAGASSAESKSEREKKLRVIVLGAHPDDPESGCGGLIALLTKLAMR